MAISMVGLVTFMALLLAGPLTYLLLFFIRKSKGDQLSEDSQISKMLKWATEYQSPQLDANGREMVNGFEYLLGLLGYAIGIGNLWRFPYLVGKWGGGAFVIAYLTCLFLVAIPAYAIEMVMGQYTREGTIGCFAMIHPRWIGLGWSQAIMLFFALGFYNILLAYACIYIVGSLVDPLPWAGASASYWNNDVLHNYGGDYEGVGFGGIQVNLLIALLAVWIIVFFSVAFGKSLLAKVTWVTVLGPVVMLVVLLIRTVTLDGAGDGIEFYIGKFDGEKLSDLDMWTSACGQIIFSLSPGFGTAITMSSYAKPKEDVIRTCMITAFCNSAFSLIGGFAIFSIVGNITYNINAQGGETTVEEQARAGPGLAFIAIAEGMKTFGGGTNGMSVLFFMVLLTLGLDSTFAWVETFLCYVDNGFAYLGYPVPKWQSTLLICVGFFLCGLPYCTQMGNEFLDVVDHYCCAYFLLLGVALEALMFMHFFGWRRFVIAVKRATFGNSATPQGRDMRPELLWKFCFVCTVPIMCIFLMLYTFSQDLGEAYGGYPDWVQAIGWGTLVITIIPTPVAAAFFWNRDTSLPLMEDEERSLQEVLNQKAPINGSSGLKSAKDENEEVQTVYGSPAIVLEDSGYGVRSPSIVPQNGHKSDREESSAYKYVVHWACGWNGCLG